MPPQNNPDRIRILFDDHRLVANAGLLLPATLARHLGLPQLLRKHLDLGGAPGRANTGDKMMTLVASALAGGDCIDDADVLRAGGTARVLDFTAKAPSTLGTFLRSFRWSAAATPERLWRSWRDWTAGYRYTMRDASSLPRKHRPVRHLSETATGLPQPPPSRLPILGSRQNIRLEISNC